MYLFFIYFWELYMQVLFLHHFYPSIWFLPSLSLEFLTPFRIIAVIHTHTCTCTHFQLSPSRVPMYMCLCLTSSDWTTNLHLSLLSTDSALSTKYTKQLHVTLHLGVRTYEAFPSDICCHANLCYHYPGFYLGDHIVEILRVQLSYYI